MNMDAGRLSQEPQWPARRLRGYAAVRAPRKQRTSLLRRLSTGTPNMTSLSVAFGGAGANTAVAAADVGGIGPPSRKAPEAQAGGNSIVCVQLLCCVEDTEAFKTYMRAMRGNYETPSDAIIDTYAEECAGTSTGSSTWEQTPRRNDLQRRAEYPMLEGSDKYQFVTVHPMNSDGQAYKLFKDAVEARDSIDVWYEAPAVKLIQDPVTRVIHGVVAQVEGQTVNVRAKNGVVLTLGGFENSPRYQQDYLMHEFWPSLGHAVYNTGDGIQMVQEVGADLWHMANQETNNFEFCDPDSGYCTWKFDSLVRGLLIAENGKRFINEHNNGNSTHGHVNVGGTWFTPCLPDLCWEIGDAERFSRGPLYKNWSADNADEINKGWVVQGDTLEELAVNLGMTEEATAALLDTVEQWNRFCENGRDDAFDVAEEYLVPMAEGPYYAVRLHHPIVNTQGGAVKNERGEIFGSSGNPIPHLYEAGEFGDIWSHLYQGANNLGGGMIFGRISGRNAAAPKTDVLEGSVMDGKQPFAPTPREQPTYEAGENQFIGQAPGKIGPVVVRVTKEDDAITAVEVLQTWDTPFFCAKAVDSICQAIVENNTPDVDVCAGATITSLALCRAVKNAIEA